MKKYDLKKIEMEVSYKNRSIIKEGCTCGADFDGSDWEVIEQFEDKEKAIEEINKYKTEISESGNTFRVTEYSLEENEYDEDGELIEGGNTWWYSKMEIKVIDNTTNETVGIFDNYADAENEQCNLEDAYISF